MAPGIPRPAFVDELSRAHFARLARCVILSGNITDLYPQPQLADAVVPAGSTEVGGARFVGLRDVLRHSFRHARYPRSGTEVRFILLELRSDGLGFPSEQDRTELGGLVRTLRSVGSDPSRALIRDLETFLGTARRERSSSLVTLTLIAELLRLVTRIRAEGLSVRPIAVIVDDAEALLPAGDMTHLSALDRESVKVFADLLRDDELWAGLTTADVYPDVVVLLSQTAAELNARIAALPRVVHIEIPLPDEGTRSAFVADRIAGFDRPFGGLATDYSIEAFVRDAKGLSLRAIDDLMTAAQRDPEAFSIGRASVVGAVNTILAERLGPIIKVVYPDHDMADVVGFRGLKARLERLRRRFEDPERAPAGITVVGPNGAGKTFILEAFARSTDRTVITLRQIRSEWYGKTDVFAEMFETGVAAFGRILILIDEAHVAFGSIHSRYTHETEARLARHMIQMIDNLPYRGRIVWTLITTRPDLLDPDFVRTGRCSLFVPIFDPEGEDARDFVGFMVRRMARAGLTLSEEERALLESASLGFSAGDYREFADDYAEEHEFSPQIGLQEFLGRWTPSSVALARQRELQILLAALSCDWPELLPGRLRDLTKGQLQDRIDLLKASADLAG